MDSMNLKRDSLKQSETIHLLASHLMIITLGTMTTIAGYKTALIMFGVIFSLPLMFGLIRRLWSSLELSGLQNHLTLN